MTIQQLRQAAKDLRDLANRFLLYGEKHSLDDAWRRLAELFRQVPLVLGNRASGFTLEGVPKSWMRSQSARTTSYGLARLQNLRQAEKFQGTTMRKAGKSAKHGSTGRKTE